MPVGGGEVVVVVTGGWCRGGWCDWLLPRPPPPQAYAAVAPNSESGMIAPATMDFFTSMRVLPFVSIRGLPAQASEP